MPWQFNGKEWEEVYDNPSNPNKPRPPSNNNSASQTPPPDLSDTSNRDTTESTNGANTEFIEVESNVLVGDLEVVPDPSYKAKTTILLQYLGKYLTGLYFVDKVTHTFSKDDGYTQSMSVSKNGFGDSLKSGSANKPIGEVKPSEGGLMNGSGDTSKPSTARPTEAVPPSKPVQPNVSSVSYTIKGGDTLWDISTRYLGNGARYPEIYNANRSIIKDPHWIYPGQVISIPPK